MYAENLHVHVRCHIILNSHVYTVPTSGHILKTVKKCAVVHKSEFQLRKRMSASECIVLTIDIRLDLLDKCALLATIMCCMLL